MTKFGLQVPLNRIYTIAHPGWAKCVYPYIKNYHSILDMFGGVGGISLQLASLDNVSVIDTYEIDSTVYKYLLYNIRNTSKIVPHLESVFHANVRFADVVVADPMWIKYKNTFVLDMKMINKLKLFIKQMNPHIIIINIPKTLQTVPIIAPYQHIRIPIISDITHKRECDVIIYFKQNN